MTSSDDFFRRQGQSAIHVAFVTPHDRTMYRLYYYNEEKQNSRAAALADARTIEGFSLVDVGSPPTRINQNMIFELILAKYDSLLISLGNLTTSRQSSSCSLLL